MKYLYDYEKENQTNLLKKAGAFFAFSPQQLEEQKNPDTEYCTLMGGLICPAENAKQLMLDLAENTRLAIAEDIKENGKEAIIKRELHNHECFCSGYLDDALSLLEDYGFTRDEILTIYEKEYFNFSANN